eukprot:1583199-Pleurochrysis_carterae.AAC.1
MVLQLRENEWCSSSARMNGAEAQSSLATKVCGVVSSRSMSTTPPSISRDTELALLDCKMRWYTCAPNL